MALGIIAIIALAIIMFETAQGASDTVDDLGGYVDTSNTGNVQRIAQAIASAEGFYVAGSRPARNHNPGDMTADLVGKSVGTDGMFVVYATDDDGWANLYAQVNAWLNGTSKHHSSDSTIADLAGLGSETGYTSTEQESWATNVANQLGVDVNATLGSIGA